MPLGTTKTCCGPTLAMYYGFHIRGVRMHSIMAGVSSGAAVHAAVTVAARNAAAYQVIVVLWQMLPNAERYITTPLFAA